MPAGAGGNVPSSFVNLVNARVGTTNAVTDGTALSTTETIIDTLVANVIAGYSYNLRYCFNFQGSVAADRFLIRLRETNAVGTQLTYFRATITAASTVYNGYIECDWIASTTGSFTWVATYIRESGTGTITPRGATSQPRLLTATYVSGA